MSSQADRDRELGELVRWAKRNGLRFEQYPDGSADVSRLYEHAEYEVIAYTKSLLTALRAARRAWERR